jgi:hypothetical protein
MSSIAARAGDRDSAGLRRWLQVGLGVVWVLDAALQYQPYMFSRGFVTNIVDPASSGNPAAIANSVTGAGHILLHAVTLFNAVFATIQLAIGLGLLWRPTAKAALAGTIAWGLAVWLLGEGLGGILTGSASPLTGAPGAAVLYVLLAVLIWPRHAPSEGLTAQSRIAAAGPAASVAAASRLGPQWPRLFWLLLWGSSAYFLLQAQVRAPGALSSTIAGMAGGEPGWLASIDRSVASTVGSSGGVVSVVLATMFLLVGLAVSIPAVTRPALTLAITSAAAIWVLTENLGGIFTGTGTDPNTGPLLILLAAAYWPLAPQQRAGRGRQDRDRRPGPAPTHDHRLAHRAVRPSRAAAARSPAAVAALTARERAMLPHIAECPSNAEIAGESSCQGRSPSVTATPRSGAHDAP